MYLPSHFEESRPEVLHALLRAHPLGLLLTQSTAPDASGFQPLQADAIPFMLDTSRGATEAGGQLGTLVAHVARANPLWKDARVDAQSVVIFQGQQAYVSPAWYPTKTETGKVVPTWNYAVVHARGSLIVHDDAQWVRAFVTRLTERQESVREKPWAVSDAPEDYIATMVKGIVGIEIPIRKLEGKWKLSQNRLPQDKAGVISGLESSDDDASQAMLRAMQP